MKPIFTVLMITTSLLAGVVVGKYSSTTAPPRALASLPGSEPVSTFACYGHTNPRLECENNPWIADRGIESFRTRIDAAIRSFRTQHPEVFVSYSFIDMEGTTRFDVNGDEKFHPASLMKVLMLAAALKEAQQNKAFLDLKQEFHTADFQGVAESEGAFPKTDGQSYTVRELIDQMIQYSDNVAVLMLLKLLGEQRLTQVMLDLKIPVPVEMGPETDVISLRSYTRLFEYLFNARYLNSEMSEYAMADLTHAKYQRGIRAAIPDSIDIAQKFGERTLPDARGGEHVVQLHHVAIVYYPGKPFLLGVMSKGGERDAKEQIIRELAGISYAEVDRQMKSQERSYAYLMH